MGCLSNAEYRRQEDKRNTVVALIILVLAAISLFLILPGMAIMSAVADAFGLALAPRRMWVFSATVSLVVFLVMHWRAATLKEAGKAYLSLSGIIALLFVVLHFGLETEGSARWIARFMPDENHLSAPAVRHTPGHEVTATAAPSAATPPTQRVRRALPLEDETLALTSTTSPSPLAPLPAPAYSSPPGAQSAKYAITGIPVNDTLNVRAGPGADFPKVHELHADYDKIVAVSPPHMNGDTAWVLITFENQSGWVAGQYIRAQ
jgi:hypothetical protein